MTLFQLLASDNRIVVLSDEVNQQVYTWNQEHLLQCWDVDRTGHFVEVESRTLKENMLTIVGHSFAGARRLAQQWQAEA